MNAILETKTEELTFEDIERYTERAHQMRSQALADIGSAMRAAVTRWIQDAVFYVRDAYSGSTAGKCA